MQFKPLYTVLALASVLLLTNCRKEEFLNNKVPIANAGQPHTINLKDGVSKVTLRGKGTDLDGMIVAYLWSQIAGPNKATILMEGSDTTVIDGLIAGTYIFQLMVVDNGGATGVDTVSVTVIGHATSGSILLRPNKNPTEVHIYGNSNYNGSGTGVPEIGAVAWTDGGTITMRGAIKFDFSAIPSGATINSAQLTLYSNPTPINGHHPGENTANYGNDNAMLIQRITANWNPSAVTWLNQPGSTTEGQIVIPKTDQPFLDLIDIDVTDLVTEMAKDNSNHGFLLKLQKEAIYNSRVFSSSYYSDSTKHPKLLVNYTH